LEEAVRRERDVMEPVKERADYVIDTSRTTTAQLKAQLLNFFEHGNTQGSMAVNVTSFGFKHGLPLEADLVFDVRFMPNPFYIEGLRAKTGLETDVSGYVFGFQQTQDYMNRLKELLSFSLPLYAEEGKANLVIAVGCTGGHHRSVAVAHALAEWIGQRNYRVVESHRDISRG